MKQQPHITANLFARLAIRQHRWNNAIGIMHVTRHVASLLNNYNICLQHETFERPDWLSEQLHEARNMGAELLAIAQQIDIDEQREILAEMTDLQSYAEGLNRQLAILAMRKIAQA